MAIGLKGDVLGLAPMIAAPTVCLGANGHPNVLQHLERTNPGTAISQSMAAAGALPHKGGSGEWHCRMTCNDLRRDAPRRSISVRAHRGRRPARVF